MGNYDEVLEASDVVIRYGDKDMLPYIYRCRAMAFVAKNDDNMAAIKELGKALKQDPKDYFALFMRARCYRDMAVDEMMNAGVYDSVGTFTRLAGSKMGDKNLKLSDDDFRQIIQYEPDMASGYSGLAVNNYVRGNYDEALDYALQALNAASQNDELPYWTAMKIYIMRADYSHACDIYVKGLDAPVRMGAAFWTLEDTLIDHAFSILQTKLQIKSNMDASNPVWPYTIGRLYGEKDNIDKQIDYMQRAYARMPSSDWYACRVASAFATQGNWRASAKYAERAINLNSDNAFAHYILANASYYQGNTAEAVREITAAIELSPTDAYYYYRRGFYNDNLHHIDDAINDYSAAIELDPDYFYSYLGRGDMYMLNNQYSFAQKDYVKVVELDTVPDIGSCAFYAKLQLGDTAGAIAFYQRLLDKYPDDGGVLYDGACFYSRMQRYDEALDKLEASLRSGFTHLAHLRLDDDLNPLRSMPRYQQILEKYPEREFPLPELPSIGGTATESRDMPSSSSPSSRTRAIESLAPVN